MKNKKKKYYIFSLDMKLLNIFSFFLLAIFIIVLILIDKEFFVNSINYVFHPNKVLFSFILIIGYMILHELLHSLGYFLYGAKYKNIVYGIELEKGIFYCLCKENIKRKNILNSLFFPLFYIGILTYIISFIIDSPYLLILSIFNISGCSGDILTFNFISRLNSDIEFSEFDNTTSFSIYTDNDLSKGKYLGLKYEGVVDKLNRKDCKKIRISKWSYVIVLILFVYLIVIG